MNLGVIYYDFAHVMKLSIKIVKEQLNKLTSSSLCFFKKTAAIQT